MATFEDVAAPRKRVMTYGKAARRRIPEYKFASFESRSQTPETTQKELPSRSPSVPTVVPPKKMKNDPRPSTSRAASLTSSVAADVFEVPSSDEEVHITPLPGSQVTKKTIHNRVPKSTKETLAAPTEDAERRKRVKLSPVSLSPPSQKAATIKPTAKPAPPKTTVKPLRQQQGPLEKGQTATVAARPKPIAQKKPTPMRTPKKLSPAPRSVPPSTPSPRSNNAEKMDVDKPTNYTSPRGVQMWKDLLETAGDGEDMMEIDMNGAATGARSSAPVPHISRKTLYKPAGVSKYSQRKLPRRRLIDSLVEQAIEGDDVEDNDSDSNESAAIALTSNTSSFVDIPRSQSLAPEVPSPPALSASQSQSQGSQVTGPKFTYSKQRSMLAEEDFMKELTLNMPSQPKQDPNGRKPRRGEIPTLKPLHSFDEDADNDTGAAGIRSVHELRQAGANTRFLDEIEDLLDRIGSPTTSPSSMRRSGLLDLASKIREKSFIRQFRANGFEQRMFVHMGRETDLIAGFIMISILMAVLADASIMPHVVAQLRTQGVARLLIRLLDSQASIVLLGKDRKSNMSKIGLSLLADHHGFLLEMPIWEELQPKTISPRTVALKCLELMVRQTREAGNSGDIISKELTTKLFSILKSASDESCWDLPAQTEAIDFCLALSALESHSIAARTLQDETIWINDYLPIVADTLEIALRRPVDDFGVLQVLVLRLTLNVTNNNPKASDLFAKESLMAIMGKVAASKFEKILRFLTEEDFFVAVDHLILVLGVMINFAEWSSAARNSFQSLKGKTDDPLDNMIQIFVDNQERTSMAESVEESQKNVAFGYLSVLLGYLSLLPAISERIRTQHPRKTIRPLVASIEEFIGHHKTVDGLLEANEDGYRAHTGLTERLESLVRKLGA